eukprot:SM000029S10519  [mRNA]  locus=s29:629895:632563:+ [translate_table: standard]
MAAASAAAAAAFAPPRALRRRPSGLPAVAAVSRVGRGSIGRFSRPALGLSATGPAPAKMSTPAYNVAVAQAGPAPDVPSTQRAWQYKEYGSVDVLELVEDAPVPDIKEDWVLVKVAAAALPLALLTANQVLNTAHLKAGEKVLVVNGSGGVGTLAVQLAKKVFGASFVAATASGAKADFVKSLGADSTIDYREQDYTSLPERYDVVCDTQGEAERGLKVINEGGRVVCITGAAPPPSQRIFVKADGILLESLAPHIENGTIRPILDEKSPYQFAEVKEAFKYLETGRATGKVVISPID